MEATNAVSTEQNNQAAPIEPSPLERRLELVIAASDLDAKVAERLKEIGKTVKMAGFRPGKVPPALVKKNYGADAYNEAMEALINAAWAKAVKDGNHRVAGYPDIQPKTTDHKEEVVFTAVFEVYPEITLVETQAITIEKPVLEVGAVELEKTLEVLRKQRVSYERADRTAQKGDRTTIDFLGKKDGEPFEGGKGDDYPVVLGEGRMLADFEAAILGMNEGDTKTFPLTFPADYGAKELAGKAVTFDIAVKKVEKPVLPDMDEAFAKALGVADGDVQKMRDEIESNLKREVKKRLEDRVKNQVMDALLKANPIEVPRALVQRESHSLLEEAKQDMQQRLGGQQMKNFPMKSEWFADRAKRRVELGLLIAEIIDKQDLKPEPRKVRAQIEEMAESYERPEEFVRWYYADTQRLAGIEGLVLENNVVEWVLQNAQVTEKTVDFDELMGHNAAA